MRMVERHHLLPGAAAFAAALFVALLGLSAGARESGPARAGVVELQLLGVNDFHGHLEPPEPAVGGAAWLGAWLDRAAASHPDRTIRVHAGDMVGVSPLISSHFDDEPTIEATNLMGLDVGTLGNHEFDEGGAEALRLVRRARYPYVAANTVSREGGELILPPYRIVERSGAKVGFIGVTTKDTPYFLLSQFAREYRWLDLSESVNRWVAELRARGVEAIVVLAHAGAFGDGRRAAGEIVDEARQMDDAVDVVIAGHTHSELNLRVGGKLIVEALSYGTAFDRVRLTVDRTSGDVVAKSALVVATRHGGIRPDPELATLVERHRQAVAPLAERVVGHAAGALDNAAVDRIAVRSERAWAGADLAFLNPGNTRSEIGAGPITYAEAAEVQAYEHPVWRLRMRGADLLEAMAEQPGLLVSGPRDLDPQATYTVAANGIVAEREPFAHAIEREQLGTDLDALTAWLSRDRSTGALYASTRP
ncbi:MAG TPA: bifunctional metallophosphatase/5'-nucleotidase [Thermoleophilaceae bacterium]|nr:bifunctional metallophosphatase/5'-nucleotidase [Thermoleophilaceae bacterium]